MKDHAGQSISVWMATAELPSFSKLLMNEQADVCVVGAGIAGLTTAYLLGRAGKSVIVLDDGPIVSGETERTTAHLMTALDDRYFDLERLHGEKGARLAAESHSAAINRIEQTVCAEDIDCDFERLNGYLFVPPGESTGILDREMAAAQRAGACAVAVQCDVLPTQRRPTGEDARAAADDVAPRALRIPVEAEPW